MRLKTIAILVLAFLATLAPRAKAQSMTGMSHPTIAPHTTYVPQGTIVGKETPEQIPDIVAFRLWLTSFDMTKPIGDQLPSIGLSDSDEGVLEQVVQTHLLQQFSITSDFNGAVSTGTEDTSRFWQTTYNLHRNTLAGLQVRLSPVGLVQFMTFLNREKVNMTVSPYDDGLGEVAKRNLAERNMVAGQVMFGTSVTANYSSYFTHTPVFPAITNTTGFNSLSNWATLAGNVSMTSGVAHFGVNGPGADHEAYAHWRSPVTADQLVSVKLATLPLSGKDSGITVRSANSGETFFDAKFYSYNGQGYILIDQMVNGNDSFQQAYAYTQAVGDTLEIDIAGQGANSRYNVILNGAVINTFSASAISTGVPGITGVVGGGDLKNFTMKSGYGVQLSDNVSGTTSCLGATCGQLQNVTHTPSTTIRFGTQGTKVSGNTGLYNSYISSSYGVTIIVPIGVTPSTTVSVDIETNIQCSVIGLFWSNVILYDLNRPWLTKMIWVTQTFGDTVSWAPDGVGGYRITTRLNCTPDSTPPDVIPIGSYNLVYNHAPYPSWWVPGMCEDIYNLAKVCTVTPPGFAGFNVDISMAPNSGLCTARNGTVNPVFSLDY